MIEIIESGAPKTPFLVAGDRVTITLRDAAGRDVFGTIAQRVVTA